MADIDWKRLSDMVAVRCHENGRLSIRGAAAAAGIPPAQINRARSGQTVGAGNYLILCRWLGIDPHCLIVEPVKPVPVPPAVSRETGGETDGSVRGVLERIRGGAPR